MSTETAPSASSSSFTPEKESVGRHLKRIREDRNLSLDEAARATKIRKEFLLAIEDDRFDLLPGPVFARGFIRSYAEYLSLDAHALLARVNRTLDGKDLPEIPGGVPRGPLVRWSLVTAGVTVGAIAVAAMLLSR